MFLYKNGLFAIHGKVKENVLEIIRLEQGRSSYPNVIEKIKIPPSQCPPIKEWRLLGRSIYGKILVLCKNNNLLVFDIKTKTCLSLTTLAKNEKVERLVTLARISHKNAKKAAVKFP